MAKLAKKALIDVSNFSDSGFGSITFNGHTHNSLAQFYEISNEQRENLFYIQSILNDFQNLPKQSMDDFFKIMADIENEIKKVPNYQDYSILIRGEKITVAMEAELSIQYQTDKQLASTSKKKP